MKLGPFTLKDPADDPNEFRGFLLAMCYLVAFTLLFLGAAALVVMVASWLFSFVSQALVVLILVSIPFIGIWFLGVKR